MEKVMWSVYSQVYDALLLKIVPYREMVRMACEAIQPRDEGLYLDAGCGTGNFTMGLVDSPLNIKVVALDFSGSVLRKAKKKLAQRAGQVEFVKSDLNQELPFEEGTFDGVICANVLYALKAPHLFLLRLKRVLKPGGTLVLITPPAEPKMGPIVREHIEALKKEYSSAYPVIFSWLLIRTMIPSLVFIVVNNIIKRKKDYRFYRESELRDLVEASGLRIEKLELIYGEQNWLLTALLQESAGRYEDSYRRLEHA